MKSQLLKQLAAVFLIIFTLLSIYFGSYLPIVKAQRYISFMQIMPTIKTFEEFLARSKSVLDFHSPVGQEEVVRYLGRDIVGMARNPNQQEDISRELIKLIEAKTQMKNVRHLLTMSDGYSILWNKYRKEEDFLASESYYLSILKIGPNLPPALYSLFDLYRAHGDKEKANEIRERILKLWPTEKRLPQ